MVRSYARRASPRARARPASSSVRRACLCILLLFGACKSPSGAAPGPRPVAPASRSLPAPGPAWRLQPLSWSKLDEVERWLRVQGPRATAAERLEAELVLAEGRLSYARRDGSRGVSPEVADRLALARDGFRRALESPAAGALQRRRASDGLREAEGLLGAGSAPAPGTRAVSRAQWGARPPVPSLLTPNRTPWNRVTVHHSAEYAGLLRGRGAAETAHALQGIQRYHMQDKGYGDIAYHFLIDPSGRVFEGRTLQWQGAHAGGSNNIGNIGVCLLGDFELEAPTGAALASLQSLLADLRGRFRIAANRVVGHGELKTTACPGRHLRSWLLGYRSSAGRSGLAAR